MTDDAVLSIAARLDALIEELDQLAFDRLREASADRASLPPEYKLLTRARRAMERASHALKGDSDDSAD